METVAGLADCAGVDAEGALRAEGGVQAGGAEAGAGVHALVVEAELASGDVGVAFYAVRDCAGVAGEIGIPGEAWQAFQAS